MATAGRVAVSNFRQLPFLSCCLSVLAPVRANGIGGFIDCLKVDERWRELRGMVFFANIQVETQPFFYNMRERFPRFLQPADAPRNLHVMRQGQETFEVQQKLLFPPSGMIYRKEKFFQNSIVKKKILENCENTVHDQWKGRYFRTWELAKRHHFGEICRSV